MQRVVSHCSAAFARVVEQDESHFTALRLLRASSSSHPKCSEKWFNRDTKSMFDQKRSSASITCYGNRPAGLRLLFYYSHQLEQSIQVDAHILGNLSLALKSHYEDL